MIHLRPNLIHFIELIGQYEDIIILNIIKKLLRRPKTPATKITTIDQNYITPRPQHCVSRADISKNALKVLGRLKNSGYEAYLVGGSVRDLLLRHAPKDFDIATNATPEDLYKLFRNCRLIGRRFRLAHILFHREIIEVATFRAAEGEHPEEHRHRKDGMLLRDNVFGSLEEDAWRRDFTINALYYNIKDFSLVDYTGGLKDINNKIIRIIGDPEQRFKEDPVRIIRALRFAAKLDFTIETATKSAMLAMADNISLVSAARLFEEILKIFHNTHALEAYQLLKNYNLLAKLFEQTQNYLATTSDNIADTFLVETLKNTAHRVKQQKPLTPAFLFAAFLWHPLQERAKNLEAQGCAPLEALEQAMGIVLNKQRQQTTIPKRLCNIMREIWLLQYRLPRRYGKRPFSLLENPRFRAGYDFLLLRQAAGDGVSAELTDWWTKFQIETTENQQLMVKQHQHKLRKKSQRKPRKPKPQLKNDN